MKGGVQRCEEIVNVLVGALHGGQTARVLACEGFGACAEERHEQILADERTQCILVTVKNLRQAFRGPGNTRERTAPPLVQREEDAHPRARSSQPMSGDCGRDVIQ
jgi:hypothetical protein